MCMDKGKEGEGRGQASGEVERQKLAAQFTAVPESVAKQL